MSRDTVHAWISFLKSDVCAEKLEGRAYETGVGE
jgi:hypothetical protein